MCSTEPRRAGHLFATGSNLLIAILAWLALPAAMAGARKDQAAKPAEITVVRAEDVGMSSERLARIAPVMQGYVSRGEVPGVVTLVARRGQVVHFEAVGMRDVEAKQPMTRQTIFRIASMTKPIASTALMMLYEEGRFQLRDPAHKFLPELAEMRVLVPTEPGEAIGEPYKTVPAVRPITIQHLLTHTAGFANTYRGPQTETYGKLRETLQPGATVGDYVKELAKLPLNFQPGDQWQYGPSTDVVGRLVEVLSGQTLDEFLRRRIFHPLGMEDTHFYLPAAKLDRFAANYRPDAEKKIELVEAPDENSRYVREPHAYFSGGGGLVSTAADYFRFHQMMLDGGVFDGVRLLSPKTVELMTTSHTGELPLWLRGPGYGFGLGYSVVTDVGRSAISGSLGTYGWGGAFCTVFWVDPQEALIGILMTQVRPYTHLNIRQDLQVLAYQAIVD
jgi:CubicO group peptidase (beta-lactamase class C family)